jgi:hypothetical protein
MTATPPPKQYRESIHGFITNYNEEGMPAVRYLRYDLQPEEARVFYDQARAKGQADFEDEYENNFTLVYNRDGTYTIVFRGRYI